MIVSIAGLFLLSGSHSSLILFCISAIPALGSLLFAMGFAIHGLRAARLANRVRELEQLTAAMSEEINQLRQLGTTSV
jgi:NAD-dependent DNA ligase